MKQPEERDFLRTLRSAKASLIMLAFGLGVLAFLVGIDRAHWFRLRPASGTAAAMWHAADRPGTTEAPELPATNS